MKKFHKSSAICMALLCTTVLAAEDVRPGLWKISLEAAVAASPDWKPQAFELTQCLTESDAQNPSRLLLGMASPGATGCDYSNRQYSGNSMTFDVSCAGTLGIKGQGQVTFTQTTLDGVLNLSMGGADKIEMQNKIHASYLGSCPATGEGMP